VPHLVGIHHPGRDPQALSAERDRMLRAVDLPGMRFHARRAEAPGLALGNLLPGLEPNLAQPARDPATGVFVMIDGELFDVDVWRPVLARHAPERGAPSDDADLVLGLYLALGPDVLERLSGMWNLVVSDPREQAAYLVTDRSGSRLLYAATDGARLTFASEAKGVMAGRLVPTRPGGVGLAAMASSGAPVGRHTWLDGVEVIDPGVVLRLDARGQRRRRYAKLHFAEGAPVRREDDDTAAFAYALRRAVERTMRLHPSPAVGITLSGGLDSRSIALAIDRRHRPIASLTFGDADSADVRYARQLAEVSGFTHHWIEDERPRLEAEQRAVLRERFGDTPHPSGFFGVQLHRILWRAEGMSPFMGFASMVWHPLYARLMRVVLNGACGDALTGSHLTPELLLQPRRAKLIASMQARVFSQPDALLERVFAPTWWREHGPARTDAFRSAFDEIDGDDAVGIASVWDMENRQRRGTFSSFCVERYFATVRAPYLDRELVDVLTALPARFRFQQRVYKRMLVRHFPEARHVPWAYTEGPITDRPAYELAREVALFAKNRAERVLRLGRPAKPRWAFRDVDKLFREDVEIARSVKRWTEGPHFPSAVFDARGVAALVDDFEAGRAPPGATNLLGHLVGIAAWTAWGADGQVVEVPPEANPARFGVPPFEAQPSTPSVESGAASRAS
jgi:asparagine synthetase B (glutamine-hydrolysing)